MDNKTIRKLFLNYCDSHNSPSMKRLAEGMGLNYHNLLKWRNDKRDYSTESLNKILTFITK